MLDAIGIPAKDINETLKFYGLLGLEFKEYGEGHFESTLPSGLRVMVDSFDLLKKINPNWREPVTPGINLCFLQKTSQDVDELVTRLTENGYKVEKEPWDAFWGQRYSTVIDPNGNSIDIFANLPK